MRSYFSSTATAPQLLALDFDGVICDGLLEYFQSTKRVYQQFWSETSVEVIDGQAEHFYQLRPVIESGWEMPLLLRALVLGIEPERIQSQWLAIAKDLQATEKLDKRELAASLDQVRDHFIDQDVTTWLGLHRFYPGVITQLNHWLENATPAWLYIVTTKEGRFVRQLLKQQGVPFPDAQVIGKEIQQPKASTLRQLCEKRDCPPAQLWFVEDLAKTLQTVAQQAYFAETPLFLADWGYNTEKVRREIQSPLQTLTLAQFTGNLSDWRAS